MSIRLLCSLGLLIGCAASATDARRSAPWCRPADNVSAGMIATLQTLATSRTPEEIGLKDSLKIDIRRASDVSLIGTEATCQRAATELGQLWRSGTTNRQVYVYKVGSDFGVENPQAGSGDYSGVAIFSSEWVYKSLLLTN